MIPAAKYINKEKLISRFVRNHKYNPDLESPVKWSEKILWRMLYDRNPLFPVLTDKYKAKDYIKGLSDAKPIPTLDKTEFPCVMKLTGWSGKTRIVRHGTELRKTQSHFNRLSLEKYATTKGEWWYWEIPFQIIYEPLIENYVEVKFFCFHGRVEYILLLDGNKRSWFTRYGNFLDMTDDKYPKGTHTLPDIRNAVECADILGEGLDHVRVDLMVTPSEIYFGEYTFSHRSGQSRWSDPGFDDRMGSHWRLPCD